MLHESEYVKIRVVVPRSAAPAIREALGATGAGQVGNYSHCSFSYPVTGRFLPLDGANPTVGEVGKMETVEEEVVEAICHKDSIEKVYQAVMTAHPYEEPAIDIMPRYDIK